MITGRRAESRSDRRTRARALAGFFLAGSALSTVVILLPGWEGMDRHALAGTTVLAAVGALVLVGLAERLGPGPIHLVTASGTALIAACQIIGGGGGPTAVYAMLYIWVILHASLFFSRSVIALQLTLTTLAHAGALVWLDDVDSLAPQLALTLGTQLAAAVVVSTLAEEQRTLADTDSLTGLGNRRTAERSLEWALARSRRVPGSPTCLALLDLDGFKGFNDRHGHVAGDRVLVEVATAWRGLVRGTDTVARTGGDEFTLVLPDCGLADAQHVVRQLIAATPAAVTCSAGLARWDGRETPTQLLERADAALYTAKEDGPLVLAAEQVDQRAAGQK